MGWSPGSDDGRPERENMKNWTMEQLYDLWRNAHFKDGQKVIVKISDNGTPKDKTDDRIISVKKAK